MADKLSTDRMAVDCGHTCCANQSGGAASNSSNGWRNETYNLAAECWSHVVGLHVDTHLSAISSAGNFLCKPIFFLPGRSVSISNRLKYFNAVVSSAACLRNGHRAGNLQLPAATLDSTNSNIMQSNCWTAIKGWLKCCLMLLGTRFLIYGRNGAGILLDFAPGPPILACRPDATCPCLYMALHHLHKQLELASVGSTFAL